MVSRVKLSDISPIASDISGIFDANTNYNIVASFCIRIFEIPLKNHGDKWFWKNIFWFENISKFSTIFFWIPTFFDFSSWISFENFIENFEYFRFKNIFQNHLSPWFFYGISKNRKQNEATMLYYPLASNSQRFRPARLLHRAAQRPPERSEGFVSQIARFEELWDLRNPRNEQEYMLYMCRTQFISISTFRGTYKPNMKEFGLKTKNMRP